MAISAIKGEASVDRVKRDAERLGLDITIKQMDQSTRTAQEAAQACDCDVGQIVKSLIFEKSDSRELVLALVSGKNNADISKLKDYFGSELVRADPRTVRNITGFAIGGVAPIGHLIDLEVVADEDLMGYSDVWAAAGKPNSVFNVNTSELVTSIGCHVIALKQ